MPKRLKMLSIPLNVAAMMCLVVMLVGYYALVLCSCLLVSLFIQFLGASGQISSQGPGLHDFFRKRGSNHLYSKDLDE